MIVWRKLGEALIFAGVFLDSLQGDYDYPRKSGDRIVSKDNESLNGHAGQRIDLARHAVIRISPLTIDPPTRRLRHDDGREVILEPRMMQVLVALADANGAILSRDDLIACCWDGRFVGDEAISSVIYRLRKTLTKLAGERIQIETIAKVGFRLLCRDASSGTPTVVQWLSTYRRSLGVGALAVALVAAVSAGLMVNRAEKSSAPVVVVAAADNSSPSRSLADDLFIKLGALQSANADALQLVQKGSDTDPDLSFKVAQKLVDGQAHATVALLAGNGGLLWSREFRQEHRPEADLRQQVAYSAALALACATEAMAPGHKKLVDRTLKLYLAGCARYTGETGNPQSFVEIFGKVTELAPDFEGGWAKLLAAEADALGGGRDPALRKSMQRHIKQARKLNPTMAEAYNAEAWLHEYRDINGWLPLVEAAVEKNPFNVNLLADHSYDMVLVGRVRQGVIYARRAVQVNPLSPRGRYVLIFRLAQVGEIEAAKDALNDAERLWPGASYLNELRFYLMASYADAGAALEMLRSGKVQREFVSPAMESFLEARIDPSPAKVERAVQEARDVSDRWFTQYVDTLAAFRRKEELIKALSKYDPEIFLGTGQVFDARYSFLHHDVRFMAIMSRWGSQLDYWRKSGNWPDFCFEPGLPYNCKTEAAKLAS